ADLVGFGLVLAAVALVAVGARRATRSAGDALQDAPLSPLRRGGPRPGRAAGRRADRGLSRPAHGARPLHAANAAARADGIDASRRDPPRVRVRPAVPMAPSRGRPFSPPFPVRI